MNQDIQLKAIAVDDETHCLDTLKWELERNCPEIELIEIISDEATAKKVLPLADIDILFMDIHLQSSSGIDLVRSLQPLDCEVVFVTAYDQYAIEAFEVEAIHYLLKPINGTKLRHAVDRIIKRKEEKEQVALEQIIKTLSAEQNNPHRLPFHVNTGIEFIEPKDIVYIAGENNYSVLHFESGKKLMISKTLSVVEGMLADHPFLRIHKSYILNLKHIVRYVKADGGYLEVTGGAQLSISRSKKNTIQQLFK